MSYLSRNDIEAIAVRVTNGYKKLPRFLGGPICKIDPEILACELCGLTLDICRLSKSGAILGLTAYDEMGVGVYDEAGRPFIYYLDGKTILVEQALQADPVQQGRYHFTVMHETAHQILAQLHLHSNTVKNRAIYYRGEIQRPPIRDWAEWQADTLASALLMPSDIIFPALCRFGLENGIDILNRVYRSIEYEKFSAMANFLGVSKQALAIRLKQLGFLKKSYLNDPYELVDVVNERDVL